MAGIRLLVFYLTLPLWLLGILAYIVGVLCGTVAWLFREGFENADPFAGWVFDAESQS